MNCGEACGTMHCSGQDSKIELVVIGFGRRYLSISVSEHFMEEAHR